MDGTREGILQEIWDWIADPNVAENILWLKGYPGVGLEGGRLEAGSEERVHARDESDGSQSRGQFGSMLRQEIFLPFEEDVGCTPEIGDFVFK